MYLKRDTIRLLEASVNSISMAVTSLGLPQRYELREAASENAIAIGLAGVSVELAMSSIIVQAQGEQALCLPSGYYKTGTHIVDDFKALINSQIPKMLFFDTRNQESNRAYCYNHTTFLEIQITYKIPCRGIARWERAI
ncbi:MAG: hypothetical protein ACJ3UO_05635 [Dehalococcoides mccartyi]|uniref:hypothetical protein n=2 Tax=Dehalococcoidaceae TaxID=1202464 RepID=UPI003B83033D